MQKKMMKILSCLVVVGILMSMVPAVVAEGASDRSNEIPDDYIPFSGTVSYDKAITSDYKLAESSSITIRVKTVEHGDGTVKTLNIESDYLPVVVACENGAAPPESLKAQAVASRTFAMYKINHPRGSNFDVWDNESDQVYNPAKTVTDQHRQSVIDTNGIVLKYTGKIICAFYVSGSGSMAKYVTYNEGKSGDDITQTTLGWCTDPPSKNPYNRGCMGQVQANDLASIEGYNYHQIIRYFYGSDIEGVDDSVSPKFLTLPTNDPDVKIQQGWYYDDGGTHESIDYIKGTVDVSSTWVSFDVVATADCQAKYIPMSSPSGSDSWGNYVLTKHIIGDDTYYTVNSHLDSSPLSPDIWVDIKRGDKIGVAGKTGAANDLIHLHFEFSKNGYGKGYRLDPYDIYSTKKDYPPHKSCGTNHYWTTCPPSLPSVISLDLIFAIDTTGSMWDDIDNVKASASEIVDEVLSDIHTARIAVVDYRDFPVDPYGGAGDYPFNDILLFSTDKSAIVAAIQGLTLGWGNDWRESVYSALMHSIDSTSLGGWRGSDQAAKVIILMGDAPPHDPEPFTGYTLSSVSTAAELADPVIIYPIQIGGTVEKFEELADQTGGKAFTAENAGDIVDAILDAIEEIKTKPVADANGPYSGYAGSPITFDGTGSYDLDGLVVSYEWDLDDDGEFDDASGATPSKTWNSAYLGDIRLKINDNNGNDDVDSTIVTVREPVAVETATGTGTAYFASDSGIIEDLIGLDESALPEENPTVDFPHGLFSFNITGLNQGQTVNITITFPQDIPTTAQYWKYHAPEGWYQIPMDSNDGDNIITITLQDGGIGDDDGVANEVIVDQGGPGIPTVVARVPTLTLTGLVALIGLLSCIAINKIRKRGK